jgi:hypothetical protein
MATRNGEHRKRAIQPAHAAGDRSDVVHDLVQVVSRRFWFGIRPQSLRYDLAVQPMPGCEGEQLHQCLRFAQTPVIVHRLTGDRYGETTQQRHVNACRRGRIWHHRRIFPRSDEKREGFSLRANGGC